MIDVGLFIVSILSKFGLLIITCLSLYSGEGDSV